MKIKIGSVTIEADETHQGFVSPKYYGDAKDIQKLKNILGSIARGMYGNGIDIDDCFWVDFLSNVKQKFPKFEYPEVKKKCTTQKFLKGLCPKRKAPRQLPGGF